MAAHFKDTIPLSTLHLLNNNNITKTRVSAVVWRTIFPRFPPLYSLHPLILPSVCSSHNSDKTCGRLLMKWPFLCVLRSIYSSSSAHLLTSASVLAFTQFLLLPPLSHTASYVSAFYHLLLSSNACKRWKRGKVLRGIEGNASRKNGIERQLHGKRLFV